MKIRDVTRITAVILATLLLLLLLWEFRRAVVIFTLSLAVAAAARPLVEKLNQRGLSRAAALSLTYLLAFGGIAVISVLVGSLLLRELQQVSNSLASTYDFIWQEWPKTGTPLQQTIAAQLPPPQDLYASFSIDQQNSLLQGLLGFTLSSFGILSDLAAMLILSIYWSIDQIHFERLWLSVFSVESRARYRDMWRAIERDFGDYTRSELLQSLLSGLLLFAGFWAMGLPFATLLAVFGALVWLLPWLGGVLALLPVALVGFRVSTGLGIFAILFTIGVLFFMEFYIEPRFIRRKQYSSLLSLVMILALSQPFGLFGLLVAPPLAAAIELILRYRLQTRFTPLSVESVERITQLHARIAGLHEQLAAQEEPARPQTVNMLARLEALMQKTNEIVSAETGKFQDSAIAQPSARGSLPPHNTPLEGSR